MQKSKFQIDWFVVILIFVMFMTFSLDMACVVYMYTHELQPTEQVMWQFMIGMFSGLFGAEAILGVINNISKRKDQPTVDRGEENGSDN